MLDLQDIRRDPLTYLAWGLGLAWFWGVAASFLAVIVLGGGDTAGFGARMYAPLAVVPAILLGVLALRCYRACTRFGRAILLTVIGTVVWAAADLYYTLVEVEQIPSIADLGYLAGPLLWGLAIVQLWRAAGIDWRDAYSFTWFLAFVVGVLAVLALPTAHVLGIPLGANLLHLGEVERGEAVLSLTYLVIDALLLHTAFVLWRRSFGFAPYRRITAASVLLCAADLLYAHRIASDTYDFAADPSDLLYFGAIGMLLLAIASFELHARAEHRRRNELLELARGRQAQRAATAVAGSGPA